MSRHIVLRCACGEAEVDGSSWFTSVVWDDVLGCLEEMGIENPYHASPPASTGSVIFARRWPSVATIRMSWSIPSERRKVDPAEFLAWWEDAVGRMREARERLPIIYRVWRGNATDVGYCVCRGRGWMVEGTYDELTAVKLPAEPWEERRAGLGYLPPVVEAVAPDLVPAFSPAADAVRPPVALVADQFERIFRGTPLTLEHGKLPDFFADELRAVEALARHAAARGEPVGLYGY